MKQTAEFEESVEVHDVPESPLLQVERKNPYGSVPGLDDEELADPAELERQVYMEEFGPVLALPVKGSKSGFHPDVDESGGVEFNAFATVDFARTMPEFDRARYKADKLQEQRRDLLIMVGIVRDRIPATAKLVLTYVRKGWLDLDEIVSDDVRAWVKLVLRVMKLQHEIAELRELSRGRRVARADKLWARLG